MLNRLLRNPIDARLSALLQPPGTSPADFLTPAGEPALAPQDAVSWRVFRNPLSVFIGGVTAVVLELAEPGVRSGVWDHSTFRARPLQRLQRTGYAAMMTVYGARSRTEAMISGITRIHAKVHGTLPDGRPYRALDPELLVWVHATASYGFLNAYHRHVHALSPGEQDAFYREGLPAARLYGAVGAPGSLAEVDALMVRLLDRLEPSPAVHEFLDVMRAMPALPPPLRPVQGVLVEAAVALVPAAVRDRLGLPGTGLPPWRRALLDRAAAWLDGQALPSHPAVQAARRLRPAASG